MKRYKKEENGKLEVGQILYTKRFKLTLDRELCKGCELCKLICPRDAISLIPAAGADGRAVAPLVDIDENKCDFHGICAVICPFSAIKIAVNGVDGLPVVEKEAFPVLERDIKVRSDLCEPECKKCEETCPLGIVTVYHTRGGTAVDVKKDQCAGCRICWMECPADAIDVTKFIEGTINIKSGNCPEGCRNCVDVCPVDALALADDGKVFARDLFCIYCGACLPVCPSSGALSITRTAVRHTHIDSGAWHRGLEKVTSAEGLARELAAERTYTAQQSANKLVEKFQLSNQKDGHSNAE